MSLKLKSVIVIAVLYLLTGCGGGGDSGGDNTNTLVHVATYDFTYYFSEGNILLDQNKIVLAGGLSGSPAGALHVGHPAFSDQVYVIDLEMGTKSSYTVNAESGHVWDGGTVANGIGREAIIRRLADGKYLIYGGFQYALNTFILDVDQASIQTYPTDIMFTDDSGLNTTPFYANNQASAVFENGDFGFFGFHDGLYGSPAIILFDANNSLSYRYSNTELTMARSNVDAYELLDGRVLLVGGADGSASPDSGARRVEIYDPASDTIQRVANYPEPKSNGQHRTRTHVTDDEVCVDDYRPYTYSISNNYWSEGCNIPVNNEVADRVIFNGIIDTSALLIGRASNGQLVYVEQNAIPMGFSDECSCYPYTGKTKIHVFSEE